MMIKTVVINVSNLRKLTHMFEKYATKNSETRGGDQRPFGLFRKFIHVGNH